MKLIKMPSIEQFRSAIRDIKHSAQYVGQDENDEMIMNRDAKMPTVTFKGTCKLHGTNASIAYNGVNIWAQSKGNIITPGKDNAGFAMFVHNNTDYFLDALSTIKDMLQAEEVVIYGEWAGKGIQKAVAISETPKAFYMFDIKYKTSDEEEYKWVLSPELYLIPDSKRGIRSIFEFKTYSIDIDFEKPLLSQNKMIELTDEVDKECPVGKALVMVHNNTKFNIKGGNININYPDVILSYTKSLPDGDYTLILE